MCWWRNTLCDINTIYGCLENALSCKESAKRLKWFKGGKVGCANRSPGVQLLPLVSHSCSLVAIFKFGTACLSITHSPRCTSLYYTYYWSALWLHFEIHLDSLQREIAQSWNSLSSSSLSCPSQSNICHKSSQIPPSSSHKLKRHTALSKLCESQIKHFHWNYTPILKEKILFLLRVIDNVLLFFCKHMALHTL